MSTLNFIVRLIRLDKPTGLLLTLLPAFLTLAFLGKLMTSLSYIVLLGGFATRSAGCLINDICDRDFDKKVYRTKDRLLASGKANLIQCSILFFFFSILSLYAASFLPFHCWPYVALTTMMILFYPLTKRVFILPQLFLGCTFAQGVLLTTALSQNKFSFTIALLYLAVVFWVFSFDTIYALADYKDDKKLNLYSAVKTIGLKRVKSVILGTHLIAHCLICTLALYDLQSYTLSLISMALFSSFIMLFLFYQLLKLDNWSRSHHLFHAHLLQGISWVLLLAN